MWNVDLTLILPYVECRLDPYSPFLILPFDPYSPFLFSPSVECEFAGKASSQETVPENVKYLYIPPLLKWL